MQFIEVILASTPNIHNKHKINKKRDRPHTPKTRGAKIMASPPQALECVAIAPIASMESATMYSNRT